MDFRPALLILGTGLLAGGCVTGTAANAEDPYEPFNRQMYAFNDGLDKAVLAPVARGYRAVTNEPVRQGVTNFVSNLGEPVTFANEVLQGKLGDAAGTVGRFVINTTVGIAGVFNPAGAMGIERTDEDFGQTLGVWGVEPGPYLVLPVIGASSPRDLVGIGGDMALNPINHAEFDGDDETRIGLGILGGISARERNLDIVEDTRETQLDPYTTLRRFHVRNRAAEVGNTEIDPEEIEKVPEYELDF
jgi:phospholipid-binding lipoprotein MlaA